ncbi:hypothetical protein EJ07DRAFT_97957, partial [Lizonia empirigonia]
TPTTTMDPRAGMIWSPEGFFDELRPQWVTEPDVSAITTIARRELQMPDDCSCSVHFLAKGAFNKVYTVRCNGKDNFIMRVSLPVQPRLKTLSEHATIEYLRQHTNLPVPRVYSSAANNDNKLGFEWMIMERVPGTKLQEQWRYMSWMKKELLVRKVIDYQVQLFCRRFPHVGNLYATRHLQTLPTAEIPATALLGQEHSSGSAQYCLAQIVSIPFFYYENWKLDIHRGPYAHSRDWLAARLKIAAVEVDNQLVYDDSDEEEDSKYDGSDEKHLTNILPKVFPENQPEDYMIHHQDLSGSNILVDADHHLSGIVDWECVHTVPLWLGCQIPKFLRGQDEYGPPPLRTEFEDEWDGKDYWRRIAEHEKTQLWEFFLEEMGRVCPEWIQVHKAGALKAEFAFAVDIVTEGATVNFERWLKQVEEDDEPLAFRAAMGQA